MGRSANVVAHEFALSGVNAGADLDPQRFRVSAQRLGAADRVRGSLERGEMAVTGALDDGSPKAFGEALGNFTESLQERPAIASTSATSGRAASSRTSRADTTATIVWSPR